MTNFFFKSSFRNESDLCLVPKFVSSVNYGGKDNWDM